MSNGNCTICPKKCHWKDHKNIPYIYTVTTTYIKEKSDKMFANFTAGTNGLKKS